MILLVHLAFSNKKSAGALTCIAVREILKFGSARSLSIKPTKGARVGSRLRLSLHIRVTNDKSAIAQFFRS